MGLLTKDEFVEVIDILKGVDKYHEDLNSFFVKHGAEGCIYQPDNKVAVLMVLKKMFSDTDNLLSWFCCESGYGKTGGDEYLTGDDGQPIDLSTPELLYDYLVMGKS